MVTVSGLEVAVVGGSLGGLAAGNVLHNLGATVTLFEAFRGPFSGRGGALGAVDVDLVRAIVGSKAQYHKIRGHGHFYGDLWKFMAESSLPPNTIQYSADISSIEEPLSDKPMINGRSFDLIIGADGGKSSIRKYVTKKEPEYSGYTLWRGLCPTKLVPEGPPMASKQVNGIRYETLGFPVQKKNADSDGEAFWNCGVYMAMPESEVEKPVRNRQIGHAAIDIVPKWFHDFCSEAFDDYSATFWRNCAAHGKVTPHAVWEFHADRVVNNRILLLGDAAHMASPRTGAGAHTAMTDAVVLGQAFETAASITKALKIYNDNTTRRGKELFGRSRTAASYFAPTRRSPFPHPREVAELLKQKRGESKNWECHN